jgi:BirA family biotin operon repressor/biotin-[acetyl-CoA-carboxylase] ligase
MCHPSDSGETLMLAARLNHELLDFLKKQKAPILPTEVQKKTGLRHGDLIGDLEALASEGYEIEFHPYLGVRLLDIPDRMLVHEIRENLNTKVIGLRVFACETCESTSDEAWLAVTQGTAQDGDLFVAERQTKGRGRQGNVWDSPPAAGLYFSFVANLKIPQNKALFLTGAASLAIANTIEQIVHLPPEIKWPNDVMIGGRKVAGVLVEARSNVPDTFVIGVGVNVNQMRDSFADGLKDTATSLRIERKGGSINRVRLLQPLVFYLDSIFAQVRKKRFDRIAKAWLEYVDTERRPVKVMTGNEEITGDLLSMSLEKGVEIAMEGGAKRAFKPEHVVSVRSL